MLFQVESYRKHAKTGYMYLLKYWMVLRVDGSIVN